MWLFLVFSVLLLVTLAYVGQRANEVDWGSKVINTLDGLLRLLCRRLHKLPATYIPLPTTGPAIVVANHVSGLDPLLLIAACRRPIRFLIAQEEYERPVLHGLFKAAACIPVDRTGNPEQALRQALRALQAGEVVALFPYGRIHLDTDRPRGLKSGVARLSRWTGAAIYPVRIDGVGGQGKVVLAPFIPSKARLSIAEPLYCQDDVATCLAAIKDVIDSPRA